MIRVILADDHPVVLLGIKNALQGVANIALVGEADSPERLFELLDRTPCDVLVTDFSMPSEVQADGLTMLAQLHDRYPGLRIIVLTKIATPAMISPILQAGALALVEKSAAIRDITTAIYRAATGQAYFTETIRASLATLGLTKSNVTANSRLSPREAEVLRLFASGYTNNQIAAILGVSAKTTSRQKKEAMRKLAARNDAELFEHARDLGLV
jgi:two-component system capsular synthesis response regulator RcsB